MFFPALEDNITALNAHKHDGVTSAKLDSYNFNHATVAIAPGDWVLVANGNYSATVNLPTGYAISTTQILAYIPSVGYIYPTIEYVSATSVKVTVNDNTITLNLICI